MSKLYLCEFNPSRSLKCYFIPDDLCIMNEWQRQLKMLYALALRKYKKSEGALVPWNNAWWQEITADNMFSAIDIFKKNLDADFKAHESKKKNMETQIFIDEFAFKKEDDNGQKDNTSSSNTIL